MHAQHGCAKGEGEKVLRVQKGVWKLRHGARNAWAAHKKGEHEHMKSTGI